MNILSKAGILTTIGICLGAGLIYGNDSKQPTDFHTSSYDIFRSGEKIVVYSLAQPPLGGIDPQKTSTSNLKDGFRGYPILAQAEILDPNLRSELKSTLVKGMNQNAVAAKCFNPRHGLRVSSGLRTVDLVICFECSSLEVHSTKRVSVLSVSNSAEALFDRILRSNKITPSQS
jgi:hypothetical protein